VTERIFQWWDYPGFTFLTIWSLWALYSFLVYWFSNPDWSSQPVSYSILTIMLLVILTNNQGRWFLLPCMKKPKPLSAKPGCKVAVVTTFVPGAEPLEMLEKTVNALVSLDYAHDTWVLDEADDDAVKALCARLGVHYFSRKLFPHYQAAAGTFQEHSKHGNYNAWLREHGFANYEFVMIVDPDHVPTPTFLSKVLGYFEDTKVAYVQVAQAYYNQSASFIARGAAEETYAYYSYIQMASYGMSYPIIVGSHNIHRVMALKQVGGLPAHDAEDVLLTLIYRAQDWQGVYVPEILARGLAPVDWSGYLCQQRRWARSVLDIKLRRYSDFSIKLSWKSRIMSCLHGLNFLHRSILIVLSLVLTSVILAIGNAPSIVSYLTIQKLGALWLVLQLCEFYRQRFYLDPIKERGIHWRVILLQYGKWPWFILALVDVLFAREVPYILTSKVESKSKNHPLLLPNLLIIAFLCGAWAIGQRLGVVVHPLVYIVASIFFIGSIILIWTDYWRFPAPYNNEVSLRSMSEQRY